MSAIPVLSLSASVGEEEAELRALHVGWKSLMMNCQGGQANGDAVTINRNHDDAENVRRSLKADHRSSTVLCSEWDANERPRVDRLGVDRNDDGTADTGLALLVASYTRRFVSMTESTSCGPRHLAISPGQRQLVSGPNESASVGRRYQQELHLSESHFGRAQTTQEPLEAFLRVHWLLLDWF